MATSNSRSSSSSSTPPNSPGTKRLPNVQQLEESHSYETICDLTEMCKHCLLHSVIALSTTCSNTSTSSLKTDPPYTHQFCNRLLGEIQRYRKKRKKGPQLQETHLIPEVEMLRFNEGACKVQEFTDLLCQQIIFMTGDDFDEENVYQICWEVYSQEMRPVLAYPKWLSGEGTFRLWLIFNALLSKLVPRLDAHNFNDIIQVMYKYVGYTWTASSGYQEDVPVSFPTFLEILTRYFDLLKLTKSFVQEIVNELYDKFVLGILFKGYLVKKGHLVANKKRRWFTLQRRVLKYYLSREQPVLKGKLVLNSCTLVKEMEDSKDKSSYRHRFMVTCGESGTPYEMSAETNRERNEWMLEIRKAIELEKAISEDSSLSLTESLATFNKLKYATAQPSLKRVDSTIRHATIVTADPIKKERAEKLAKMQIPADYEQPVETKKIMSTVQQDSAKIPSAASVVEEYDDQKQWISPVEKEFYMPMESADQLSATDSDEEGYTFMYKGSTGQDPQEEKELKPRKISETEKRMSTSPVALPAQDDVYTDCDFDSPRYVPKTREMISRSHTSSSYLNVRNGTTPSSLEASVDHFETVSEFLGKGTQDESKYLEILPEAGTSPPVVPPRTVYASKSTKSTSSQSVKSVHYTRRKPIDEPTYILPQYTNSTKLK